MKTKILTAIIMLALVLLSACTAFERKQAEQQEAQQQEAELQEDLEPGTVVYEAKSQIKFKVQPPEGSSESIPIGN